MSTKTLSIFDLAPGKTLLDRYKICRSNRHGGMATTFEVDPIDGGAHLELQIFPGALFESTSQAGEFARSLERWKTVRPGTILAVRDVHSLEDGTVLFLTDFPPGRTLRERLKEKGRATAAETVGIGIQILDELSAIHAAGLVHGDVKPHTIQIEPRTEEEKKEKRRPHVLLVDGGITPALWSAKHLGDKTQLIGTPYYAPVEQFGGEAADVQSDVYNLATVLYETVSGALPWRGKSFLEVFQAKLSATPPSMKSIAPKVDVPHDLELAIAGGLLADKSQRYPSAAAFKSRLTALRLA
jgi:serine/threonine-protein kinase